ncbi:MAG TPA: hypothetical protein VJV79_37370 [Polyangiaceae bacterium]|nr:hypothetical protein [Polyangiaceae bacterium]
MKTSILLCVLAAAFAAQSLAGCSEIGLVGGKCDQQQVQVSGRCLDSCPEGQSACSGQCVDLEHDEDHCGSCDNACSPQQSCLGGECVDSGTGGSSGTGTGGTGTGGTGTGGVVGMSGAAGESPAGSAGQGGEGGMSPPVCEPPFNTPEQCGSCDVQCTADKPVCGQVGAGYECQPMCEPSTESCDGSCTDLDNDPDHCGSCDKVCESGYCFQGMCVGGTFGHVVLMCIDYEETARSSPSQRLLGNSVLLPGARLARVLAFDGFTPPALRDNVDLTLSWAAGDGGGSYLLTHESDPDEIPNRLTIENFDTFLVYSQPDAPSGTLATLGAAWQAKIDTFVADGGTVVVLSGGEMREFIGQAGLLNVTVETEVTGSPLFNRTPTDAVGLNVLSPFQARANTCRFTTTDLPSATLSYVITGDPAPAPLSAPVVVHRTFPRP